MTKWQTDSLRLRAKAAQNGFGNGRNWFETAVGHEELTQLLNEREELLESLQRAYGPGCGHRKAEIVVPLVKDQCHWCTAHEAIEKALGRRGGP